MNLFAAAGLDLPSGGASRKRTPVAALKHKALFPAKLIEKEIAKLAAIEITDVLLTTAQNYARTVKSPKFLELNELKARPVFEKDVLRTLLGFKDFDADATYDYQAEFTLGGRSVDFALGRFGGEDEQFVLAPLEMKGPDTFDLDRIMSGRGLSPVQQAWDYAADAPGARWVLVSNCIELRLYRVGEGREAYERFDLSRIDEPDELRRLKLILDARRLLDGETDALFDQAKTELREVTDGLYKVYRGLRERLIGWLEHGADGPRFSRNRAIQATQKLLDRILFVAFASRNGMLPERMFKERLQVNDPVFPRPQWAYVREYFRRVDTNRPDIDASKDVWPYNGGLFSLDPDVDDTAFPDELVKDFGSLLEYDYGDEISVNVLGHIFEQSISDLEKLRDETPETAKVSQRKRDGVVYTPEHVTRFLVQKTIGVTLDERRAALLARHGGLERLPSDKDEVDWPEEAQRAFWQEWHGVLQGLTILDPACGSGAFLVAAFEFLAEEYRRTVERLAELDVTMEPGYDIFDDILSRNIFGVDLNVESVEIARLALWLKSARRQKRLAKLDAMVQAGDSLIDDPQASTRAFNWREAFPEVMDAGGFDIVIGNPPYVRAELLKDIRPWLSKQFTVADGSADLYAYFFEQGVRLLKKGGRLGFISSSTFFRTGSGERLRLLLNEYTDIETVIDFGDVQIFEGVTTYPAILTMRKRRTPDEPLGPPEGDLAYLTFKDEAPNDLGRAFDAMAKTMPRARLTGGSWQLENEALANLRAKIIAGKRTLKEVYGEPKRGILTGLNEAFVIDTPTRDRLVEADPKSAELLKPFLIGDDLSRWRADWSGSWVVNVPSGSTQANLAGHIKLTEEEAWLVFSRNFSAISGYLLHFAEKARKRLDQGQYWWELRPCSYSENFCLDKIVYPVISQGSKFSLDSDGFFHNDKCYHVLGDQFLLSLLNSKVFWFWAFGETSSLRGGQWRLELREQNVSRAPIPAFENSTSILSSQLAKQITKQSRSIAGCRLAFHTRLLTDLATPGAKLNGKLKAFHTLSFKELQAEIKKALKADIPVKERSQWQALHEEASAEIKRLEGEIAAAEAEINRLVYEAFELTPDEIALLEASLEGQV